MRSAATDVYLDRVLRAWAGVVVASALIGLAGCAGSGSEKSGPVVNTGLDHFDDAGQPRVGGGDDFDDRDFAADRPKDSSDDLSNIFEQNAELLGSLPDLDSSSSSDQSGAGGDGAIARGAVTDAPSQAASNPSKPIEVEIEDEQVAPAEDEPSEDDPAEATRRKQARLVGELAAILRDRAERSPEPFLDYAALAVLEAIEPGTLNGPSGIAALTPREADQLTIWRDLMRELGEGLSRPQSSEVESLAAGVERAAERMGQWNSLTIQRAELCTKVEGYGVFTPLKSRRLLARRAHRAIVYVELDDFASKPATGESGAAGYKVHLEQEVSVFHDSDGVLAWRTAAQPVEDFSRNRRREFYTVQVIELPEALTVGAYRLKVSVRDKATGALAESIIPFEVVADANLAGAPSRKN